MIKDGSYFWSPRMRNPCGIKVRNFKIRLPSGNDILENFHQSLGENTSRFPPK